VKSAHPFETKRNRLILRSPLKMLRLSSSNDTSVSIRQNVWVYHWLRSKMPMQPADVGVLYLTELTSTASASPSIRWQRWSAMLSTIISWRL